MVNYTQIYKISRWYIRFLVGFNYVVNNGYWYHVLVLFLFLTFLFRKNPVTRSNPATSFCHINTNTTQIKVCARIASKFLGLYSEFKTLTTYCTRFILHSNKLDFASCSCIFADVCHFWYGIRNHGENNILMIGELYKSIHTYCMVNFFKNVLHNEIKARWCFWSFCFFLECWWLET